MYNKRQSIDFFLLSFWSLWKRRQNKLLSDGKDNAHKHIHERSVKIE